MSIELKIKLKTLAYEAKEIRKFEKKLFKAGARLGRQDLVWKANSLHDHRQQVVRNAARSTHLAYGFIKGKPYEALEKDPHTQPNWKEVLRMICNYGPDIKKSALEQWANLNQGSL
jgi:hypothetical protein